MAMIPTTPTGSSDGRQPDDLVHDDVATERAEHEHLAVREVDQLQHAVDERVAQAMRAYIDPRVRPSRM